MLETTGGFVLIRGGVLRSYSLMLALSQGPERVEGEEQERLETPRFCNPCVGFSQAPEHVEWEGL
jgi:hypothetical protein